MNAIEEINRLKILRTEFGINAKPVKYMKCLTEAAMYKQFEQVLSIVRLHQNHKDIEEVRLYLDDIMEHIKVRTAKRSIRSLLHR